MNQPLSPDRLTSDILKSIKDWNFDPFQRILLELLLDIRSELRQIRSEQGEIKWSSKL